MLNQVCEKIIIITYMKWEKMCKRTDNILNIIYLQKILIGKLIRFVNSQIVC